MSGLGGTFTLDEHTVRPMVILRNPATGQIRAFLGNPPATPLTETGANVGTLVRDPQLTGIVSRGIPKR